jgi:hypothetical protein
MFNPRFIIKIQKVGFIKFLLDFYFIIGLDLTTVRVFLL